jgi:haloacid dehalogenase superfamily, subfamily IA, variant 3 with third motif having DD or ED/haloacid dehalogenase superfamily, subfamily IA, variant 1 with third motif having Dx(3-4)D or Dx(3-4)E
MRPNGVLFDMDGCLVNSEVIYVHAWQTLFERKGIPISREEIESWKGLGWKRISTQLIERGYAPQEVENLYHERDAIFYEKFWNNELQYMPGILPFLDYLDEEGIPYGVATSTYREKASKILEHMKLLPRMQFVVCGDDVKDTKPAPDIYLEAIAQLGIPREEVYVFEDSKNGILAARNAKLKVIQVLNEEDYEELDGVEYRIKDYKEMLGKW